MYQRQVFERYFNEKEERQLMQCVRGAGGLPGLPGVLAQRDAAWMSLLRQTGIRVTPLSALTVGDARAALSSGHLLVRGVTNKRGREQKVPLNRRANEALCVLLKVRAACTADHDFDAPLIVSREHNALSVRALQQRMQMWCDRAGLADGSPHWMRHTLAKRILARSTARNPLSVIAGVLGHSSVASTDFYTQPDKDEIAQAMEVAA
jgi:site-specific recombinase XerC